ncbi:AMP-binding protein, partial [candidate division CSSED10-310 bacterium]
MNDNCALEQSISECFEKQVDVHRSRVALAHESDTYTYAILNRLANRVAHTILMSHRHSEKPIVFFLEHGAMQIVAIIGILKAGKIYVPLDPSYPESMLKKMRADSGASLIISNNRNIATARKLFPKELFFLNIDRLDATLSDENPDLAISPDTPANIYYTSGSTGEPKGVVQNHRNILRFIREINETWNIGADDRIAHVISCGFSASVLPCFGPLLNGASAHLYDCNKNGLTALADWINRERITIFFTVPSLFRQLACHLSGENNFSDLRLIVFTGETLYKKDIDLYKRFFAPECKVRNRLGGSEMHYVASFLLDKSSEIKDDIIPAGYPIEGKKILILDDERREVDNHQVGEIAIKSRYLSPGYWRQPELTRQVFLPDPAGGEERIYLTGDLGRIR